MRVRGGKGSRGEVEGARVRAPRGLGSRGWADGLKGAAARELPSRPHPLTEDLPVGWERMTGRGEHEVPGWEYRYHDVSGWRVRSFSEARLCVGGLYIRRRKLAKRSIKKSAGRGGLSG